MNISAYSINIINSPPQEMPEKIVNCMDKSIFKGSKSGNCLYIGRPRKGNSQEANPIEAMITDKIRSSSPFKEVWNEIIQPNFQVKEKAEKEV